MKISYPVPGDEFSLPIDDPHQSMSILNDSRESTNKMIGDFLNLNIQGLGVVLTGGTNQSVSWPISG